MREALLKLRPDHPDLDVVDADFAHLFASWFNRGFLVLRSINWSTRADILEKILRYEDAHEIGTWDELRRRLGARLERINFLADRSPWAMREAHGLMVNYLYKLDEIETNHEAFAGRGEVVAAQPVHKLLRRNRSTRNATP